jgi:hypothetical protein
MICDVECLTFASESKRLVSSLFAIQSQLADRAGYLRLAETITSFLARLRATANTLDVSGRQRIVRLLVKEILVSNDAIVIRHSIPTPTGSPAAGGPTSPPNGDRSSVSGPSYLLRTGRHLTNPGDVRYADDTIVGFQRPHEARTFLNELMERMGKFELALHPDKTRLIRFGRHAAKQHAKLGEGKPETFDFLGFTHFCTRSRKWGSFVIGRKTIKRARLLATKIELRRTMHDPIAKTGAWMKGMPQGHLNYFAVTWTSRP